MAVLGAVSKLVDATSEDGSGDDLAEQLGRLAEAVTRNTVAVERLTRLRPVS
jgi:hypothetical protein